MSSRLQELAAFYHNENIVWDIGCDHGKLGLMLLDQHESIKQLYLVDQSVLAMKTLKKNIIGTYIPKGSLITLLNQPGQTIKLTSQKEIVYMAGMGGKIILTILEHLQTQWHSDLQIVISPHTEIWKVRSRAREMGFRLRGEKLIKEGEHFYQILSLAQVGKNISDYGETIWNDSVGESYRQFILNYLHLHRHPREQKLLAFLHSLDVPCLKD